MNWTEIKEKYPKGYKIVLEWFGDLKDIITWRHLYDFFDEQRIYIEIRNTIDNPVKFDWLIQCKAFGSDLEASEWTKTRTEAEEQAFLKAFSILEEKL